MQIRCLVALGALLVFSAADVGAQGGPPGARVFNLFADPESQGMVYAATSRGIFRSDNGGLSWGPASGGLTSPDTSWITGAGGRLYTATLGAGVFRSDDGGNNWTPATTGLPDADTLSLGVNPSDPQVVYAGTRNEGIFKTTNGGDSWVAVNNGLLEFVTNGTTVFEGDYNQIAVDPNNPETVFAMHSSNVRLGNGIWFRSTNGGQQWFGIAAGASGLSVAVDPIDSNNIYAGTANGMARSQDGGETVQVLASFPAGVSANALAIDPVDPQTIYAASGRFFVFRSTDGGDTWAQAFNGLAQGTLLTVAIDPQEPSNVYTGSNGGGVFHTMDRGENWHLRSDGMGTSDVRALAVDPVDSANVIAGVFGGGAFRSTDSAGRWQEARAGLATVQLRDIAFAPSDPNIVFGGSVNPFASGDGSLFKSTNGGMDWTATVTGISIFSIAVDPVDPQLVYLGTSSGAFKSVDGGLSFVAINDVQGEGFGSLGAWTLLDVEIDPNTRNTLYATGSTVDFFAGQFSQVFKTTNAGVDWTGTGVTQIFTLVDSEVDPFDSSRVIVGSNGGVFRKIGNGGFERINNGLPDGGAVLAARIAFDPNEAGTVYTATSAGVFKSTNRGDSWATANEGLQGLATNKLAVDPWKAGVLYAGTAGGGVFKTENGGAQWTPTRSFVTTDPVLTAAGIVGSPDFQGGGVSPGEIVTFFALNVGPEVGVSAAFDPKTGKLPTELAGVRVFFNGVLAAIFFVRDGQINCQVPYEMAGLEPVEVRVEVNGVSSNVVTVRILDSHPGIFNAILNQNLSLNTDTNPEAAGNFIVLFVTGQGLIDPALMSGEAAPFAEPLPRPVLPVSVTIDGREAVSLPVMAPGFVGLLQINVLIPPGLPPGTYEVFVEIGGRRSQVAVLVVVG